MSSPVFTTTVTKEQAKDSGMAVVLILLLIGFIAKEDIFFRFAAGALLIDMIFPMFYYPFAIFWFGLANIMGFIISKILLVLIYLVIVLPIALARQLIGKDTLLLKRFKKGSGSIMRTRNHVCEADDLIKPF
ncbi:MAG: hypothetical protein K0B08_04725 [Bacteroidales bacterium]|nr:hypothetical protein [Bacteroidales bacterium]